MEESAHECGIIGSGGQQGSATVWAGVFPKRIDFPMTIVATGAVCCIRLVPDVACARHPQWIEHFFLCKLLERHPGYLFDRPAEVEESFAGIGILFSRLMDKLPSPVGKTSGVGQDQPGRYLFVSLILGQLGILFIGKVFVERFIQL